MSNRPPQVRSLARRYFCGCIPVSVGTFITSIILLVLSVAMVGWIIFLLTDKKDIALVELPHDIRTGLIVVMVIFILMALVSLLGLIGTIRRNRQLVRIYSWAVFAITATDVAGEVYLFIVLFIRKCKDQTVDGVEFQCISISTAIKAIFFILSLVLLVIQIYVAFVIRSYQKQLKDEEYLNEEYMAYNRAAFDMPAIGANNAGTYAKIPLQDEY